MKTKYTVALAMLAGFGLGATAIHNVGAQGMGKAPGAYAVVDISEITDAEGFKKIAAIAAAPTEQAGGKNIIRTNNIVALVGAAPKRFVVIAFDSVDKAKAWNDSAGEKAVNAILAKTTKSRVFIAEGM